jgi:hypothetical protein
MLCCICKITMAQANLKLFNENNEQKDYLVCPACFVRVQQELSESDEFKLIQEKIDILTHRKELEALEKDQQVLTAKIVEMLKDKIILVK